MVLQAAFDLMRREGIAALNARSLARELGTSTQPVFSQFPSMEALHEAVFLKADEYAAQYFLSLPVDRTIFERLGMAYVDLALQDPYLFRLLFFGGGYSGKRMDEFVTPECAAHILEKLPDWVGQDEQTRALFTDYWLYVHGLACMLVANQLQIGRQEIAGMIGRMAKTLMEGHLPQNGLN